MPDIILDTNVLSELFRPDPSELVLKWLTRHDPQSLYLTVFTLAEIYAGIDNLPAGKKGSSLASWLDDYVLPNFEGRILSFDIKAAPIWGRLTVNNKKQGHPRPAIDTMIASIALAHGLSLATRNTKDFEGLSLKLVNPFEKHK